MACKLVLVPSFPGLLDMLLHQLRTSCLEDPLGPKWVVVPTSTAVNHLRVRLGREAGEGVLGGVRVVPVANFIDRLGSRDSEPGVRRWNCALDLPLFELVEQLPPSSPLVGLHRMPSGYRLLRPTFLDLADGGFGPDQCEILQELAQEPELAPLEREVVCLYVDWLRLLEARSLNWQPLQQQQVPEWIARTSQEELLFSLACEEKQSVKVFIYGFYDFTDINVQIISSLAQRVPMAILYPCTEPVKSSHPAFSFAHDVLEDLKVRLGTALSSVETRAGVPSGAAGESASERFFLSTFPEGEIPDQPSFLTFQRASGIRSELLCAALRVRQWIDDPENPIPLHQIMVLAPDLKPYSETIRQVFDAFAIPVRIVDAPAGLTPENRALHMLARLWEDRAPAEWVLAYLRNWPGLGAAGDLNLDQFESKVRQVGIWGGSSWLSVFDVKGRQEAGDTGQWGVPQFTKEEGQLVREVVDLWGGDAGGRQRTFTPQEAIAFLKRVQKSWLPQPALLDTLLKGLEGMQSFRPDFSLEESLLREMMTQLVGDQTQSDPLNQEAVLFLPLMRARGLTSKAIVFLGLASGNLPSRIQEDPLLSDLSRGRLVDKAGAVGHRLPIKSHVTDEMSMLFFLLNTSAESIHWVIPESDESGRSVAPTPWVQRYIQRWERDPGALKYEGRMPRGPAQQAELLLELDPEGLFLPPDFLVFVQPDGTNMLSSRIPYRYLLEADRHRRREVAWNGHVPEAAMPDPQQKEQRISVTDLEVLARCPFRYYVDRLAQWRPLIPLEFPDHMNPLDWGGLVHACLEYLIQPYLGQRVTLQEIAKQLLGDSGGPLRKAVASLPNRFLSRLEILPIPFRQVTITRLETLLKAYFEEVAKGDCSGDFPVELELKRRVPFPGLVGLRISGQIDRIDERDNVFHVYDYKSGKSPPSKLSRDVSLGYKIQPVLYPWILAEGRSQSTAPAAFSFIFLGDSPPSEKALDPQLNVEEFLKPFAEMLETGMYLPTPSETMRELEIEGADSCLFCEYASLCRRFDWGACDRYVDLVEQELSSRLLSMGRSSQQVGET